MTEGTDPFAVFVVSLSNPSALAVSFNLALTDVTARGGGTDYGAAGAGNLQVSTDGGTTWNDATVATFVPGTTSVLVRTPITDDLLHENTETFTLTATRTVGITTNASALGTGTIIDNDGPPTLSINDVRVNEGAGTATFTVTLSAASGLPITVDYSMTNGTAGAQDYTAMSGTLIFAPGETTKTIAVPILEDKLDEPNETFTVNLANPVNATIADAQGVGTIVDNDAPPAVRPLPPPPAPNEPPNEPAPAPFVFAFDSFHNFSITGEAANPPGFGIPPCNPSIFGVRRSCRWRQFIPARPIRERPSSSNFTTPTALRSRCRRYWPMPAAIGWPTLPVLCCAMRQVMCGSRKSALPTPLAWGRAAICAPTTRRPHSTPVISFRRTRRWVWVTTRHRSSAGWILRTRFNWGR